MTSLIFIGYKLRLSPRRPIRASVENIRVILG